jgi:hypothetical protein
MQQYFGQLKALKAELPNVESGTEKQDIRKEIEIGKWLKEMVQNRVAKKTMGLDELQSMLREGIDNQIAGNERNEAAQSKPVEQLREIEEAQQVRAGTGGGRQANASKRKSGGSGAMNNIPEMGAEEEAGYRPQNEADNHKKEGNKFGRSGLSLARSDPKEEPISNEFKKGTRGGVSNSQARDEETEKSNKDDLKVQEALKAVNEQLVDENKRFEGQIRELQNELRKRDETIVSLEKSLARHQVSCILTSGNRPEKVRQTGAEQRVGGQDSSAGCDDRRAHH